MIDSIASCKENYERKLDQAKYELLQKEEDHPLFARCERLHQSLERSMTVWRTYKQKLKTLCSVEEFADIRDEAEGINDCLDMLRRLKDDMKEGIRALKPENPNKSPLGPEE